MRIEICSWIIVLGVSFIAQDLFWKRFAMWYRIFLKNNIHIIYIIHIWFQKTWILTIFPFFYAFICVGSIWIQSIDWSRNKFGLSPKKHCPRVCLSLCLWLEGQGLFVSQRCHNACFKLKRAKFLNIYNIIPPEPWNHVVHLVALKLQVQLPCRSAIPLKLG